MRRVSQVMISTSVDAIGERSLLRRVRSPRLSRDKKNKKVIDFRLFSRFIFSASFARFLTLKSLFFVDGSVDNVIERIDVHL